MTYFKKINFHIITFIIIALSIVFTYWNLPNTFFQQDEWQSLTYGIYYQGKSPTDVVKYFFPQDAISHFNPLATIFGWLEFLFFYTNFTPYAWLSIFLHILDTFLLYYFILFWLKNRKIAIFSSIFFGLNSIPHQAVSWVAAANSYEVPAAFILLSLIFFQRFLTEKGDQRRNIFISLTMLFISLMFHENGIFLFVFYPIIFFLYARPRWKGLLPTFSKGIILTVAIFILVRIPFFFGFLNSLPTVTDISRPPILVYPYRLISLGVKSFAGSFFPEKTLINISEEVVRLAYPQFLTADRIPNPFITQSIVFDLVSHTLSFLIVGSILLCMGIVKEKKVLDAITWSVIFIPLSFLPYAFVLGKAGYASIFEPKFFYVGSIGISILVGILVYSLNQKFANRKLLKIIVYLLFGLYITWHIYLVKTYVKELVDIGTQRKAFLTTIETTYPQLPKKVVFFTESNIAYYGMPDSEKILPVQIGFGKMLMIWYQGHEHFPVCMYEGQFLLPLLEEGYRSCDGRGFGYYRDYDKLKNAVLKNRVPVDHVISYSWSGQAEEFKDITLDIRKKLTADLKK